MNLLLDLGNSRCKFEILEKEDIKEYGAREYSNINKLSVIESLLYDYKIIKKVIVCSVLDDKFNDQIIKLLNNHAVDDYYFLNPAVHTFGIRLGYRNPSQLGADRLAALIAAHEKFSGNKCIVDCGTAITIDALDANGMHRGGVILPGFTSMQQALSVDTDIKHKEPGGSFNILSSTTQDAIFTGCLSAVVGGIQHVINTVQVQYDSFDRVIITGGEAELVAPMLSHKFELEPKLVLDGLMIVLRNV